MSGSVDEVEAALDGASIGSEVGASRSSERGVIECHNCGGGVRATLSRSDADQVMVLARRAEAGWHVEETYCSSCDVRPLSSVEADGPVVLARGTARLDPGTGPFLDRPRVVESRGIEG